MNTNFGLNPNADRRWMVVDDNADTLTLMQQMLQELGGKAVESYASPAEALTVVVADPEKFELVITDFEMPVMNGLELSRCLRASAPGLKIILATGSGFFRERFVRNVGLNGLLNKPFPMVTLRNILSRAGVKLETPARA